jgi:hypothetical protein
MTAQRARSRALVSLSLLLSLTLAGCDGSQPSSKLVSAAPYNGPTDNASIVTRSTSDRIETMSGGTRTLSFTFNSSDAHELTNLRVTTDLTKLPAGWHGPASFSCASVTTGSGCVLNLTHSPVSAGRGTFNIDYSYTNDLGQTKTGSESVDYVATSNNNVVANAAPTGQVIAIAGEGSQPVNVTFTTDDGRSASALQVTTSLGSLPSGWSASDATFGCDTVRTGNGCQLSLTYAPSTGGSGTVALGYTYQDNSGTSKNGSINIGYAGTTRNNVNGTVTPSGQIAAVIGSGGLPVNITFTTDDGFAGSALQVTTALTSLPTGWSSSSGEFDCDSVSTGSGCQLTLTYAPAAPASGTLTLAYTYRDNAGTSKNGSINIAYTGTTSNNVNGAVAPGGQITAVVGGNQPVNITFTPDDANTVTQFVVTTDLTTLPAGWSSTAGTLTCATVSTAVPCDLSLVFAPSAYSAGNLTLNYSYRDNSGIAKTGTVIVPYVGTVHNNVAGTATQSPLTVHTGQTQTVTITYATDDGNPATNFSITNLAALPTGWHGPTSFNCATVTGNNSCQLSLSYAPTSPTVNTLMLDFNYRDDSGTLRFGTATINYSAENYALYISQSNTLYISRCEVDSHGALQSCTSYGRDYQNRTDLGYRNGKLFFSAEPPGLPRIGITWPIGGGAYVLSATTGPFTGPLRIGVHAALNVMFVSDVDGLKRCTIDDVSGSFFGCSGVTGAQPLTKVVFSADATLAYGSYNSGGVWRLQKCNVSPAADLSGCINTGINTATATMALQVVGDRLYSLRDGGGLLMCPINSDGSVAVCVATATGEMPVRAAFTRTNAYLTTNDIYIRRCPIRPDGTLDPCVDTTDPSLSSTLAITVQ